ncbi:MAG: adenylate/guanylate cyclase domain-containing protein [Endomicrobia bacterium]|nr:adenylate/guanylate cyclase domain-containing protein [Endomicrobiia bacterium]
MIKIKKTTGWICVVTLCTLFIIVLYITDSLSLIEHIFYDLRFKTRGPKKLENNIVIIKIDEESLSALGRWPWDRKILATTVENLFNAGAKVVALDILFPEPSNKNSDKLLSIALRKGKSVLACHFENVYENILKDNTIQKILTEKLIYPIELFSRHTKVGFANVEPDDDGTVRSVTLYKKYKEINYYSFNYIIAKLFLEEMGEKLENVPQKIYINYYGPSEFFDKTKGKIVSTFVGYSLVNIYHNIIPSLWLKDKIVLIGSTATGSYDHYPTPFVKTYPGVELHATVIQNLLTKSYCTYILNKEQNLLLIITIATILSFVFYKTSPVLTLIFMFLFSIGYYFFSFFLFDKFYKIIDVSPYLSIFILLGFASIFYKLLFEQQEKKIIKTAFSRYINPYVMEELLRDPTGSLSILGGQKREITVVFTDIRQFTTISEKLPAEEVVNFLNAYFQMMNNIIFKYNGTIDKYIGDCIMCFWNAPLKQHDHPYLAVRCVIEMFNELEKFKQVYKIPFDFTLKIGAGINTGEAVVGNIGSSHLMEYTAVGDTVNIASRLQTLTKEFNSPIIISEYVKSKIGDRIPTTSLGKIKLRGKEQEIEIFKVENLQYSV